MGPYDQLDYMTMHHHFPILRSIIVLTAEGKVYEATIDREDILTIPVNGTSYLPLRFVSESLGAKVDWLQKEYKISITMK